MILRTRRHPKAIKVPVRSRGLRIELLDADTGVVQACFLHPDNDEPGLFSQLPINIRNIGGIKVTTI